MADGKMVASGEAQETTGYSIDDDAPSPDEGKLAKGPTATEAAPTWLTDLRTTPFQTGFYESLGRHGLHFVERTDNHLVISFDNLSSARTGEIDRESWGYGFIRKQGWSHLGVFAYEPNWFRDEALFDRLTQLAASGFFLRFKSVTMTGTSMGAYAATAFASLAPGCRVIAFSPQSTLRKSSVPWEKRFSSGRKANWDGRFSEGPDESRAASAVWLIFDPLMEEDRKHAERYSGENVHFLRARYAGHKSALFLRRADLLSTIVRAGVEGSLTERMFYSSYRKGRDLPWYLNGIASRLEEKKDLSRLQKVVKLVEARGRPNVARLMQKRISGQTCGPSEMTENSHYETGPAERV